MSNFRKENAIRKTNQFFRYVHDKLPAAKSSRAHRLLSNLSGSTRKNKKSLEKLMRALPEIINIEPEFHHEKRTGCYIPITAWMSYEGKRTKIQENETFKETSVMFTAYFKNKVERCRFSWHAMLRLFERYDDMYHEHNIDKILFELAKIFKELNIHHAVDDLVQVRNRKLVWSRGEIDGIPGKVFNISTFYPLNSTKPCVVYS